MLAGVIYFHRISETRWRMSDTRSFGWLRAICGEEILRNVVLVTNMWDSVDQEVGAERERQLAAEFFKPALDRGAQILRHYDSPESAHDIIRAILANGRTALQVQQELINERREFDRTTVGQGLSRMVEEYTRRLQQRVDRLRGALAKARSRGEGERSQLEAKVTGIRRDINKHNSRNMNASYKDKKTKAEKRWAFLFSPVGIGLSSILLCAVGYALSLYM